MSPFTIAPYGDSLTTQQKLDLPAAYAAGLSWVLTAAAGPEINTVGGYAHTGFNAYEIYTNVVENRVNCAIWLAGTNDRSDGVARYKTRTYMLKSLDLIRADNNLILPIPPMTGEEAEVADFNAWLQDVAYIYGAEWLDPWTTLRDSSGAWLPGVSLDGRHQTPAASVVIGNEIRAKVFEILA